MESKHLPKWWVLLLCKKMGKVSYSYYYFVDRTATPNGLKQEWQGVEASNFFTSPRLAGTLLPTPDEVMANEPAKGDWEWKDYTTKSVNLKSNGEVIDSSLPLSLGIYTVEYKYYLNDNPILYGLTLTYTFAVVANKYPLKKWTVTDVVNRCLELIEPLRGSENPRYRFDGVTYENGKAKKPTVGSQAEKYDKVLAPEFAMTKQTLREQLKQVGGFIHAEPRLKDGVIYFDEYGKGEISPISLKNPISIRLTQDINEYCTELDSQADNLVNRLDYAQGVVIEPFSGGYQTLRTETTTVRIGEDNGIITTQRPIYEISQVRCKYALTVDDGQPTAWSDSVDISAYLFETAEYRNLSSFEGAFPFAKEYALEYTQGSPNISGLFFKSADLTGGALENYAIVKILEAEGVPKSAITSKSYALLSFEISYIPIFSERVKTNKALIIGKTPRSLAYNQSANLIETRYFGENLKGVVARLGNVEKTLTYKVAFLTDIPKSGDKFDDEYYISAVSVEYLPFFIKVTVGLSKDFNRLSQYVGISSNLRMYEVSEKQAQRRDSVFTEYLVVSDKEETPTNYTGMAQQTIIDRFKAMFSGATLSDYTQINQALVRGRDYKKNLITPKYAISLPVVSSALGNTLTFSFNFADNYSAGQKSTRKDGGQQVTGYWGEYVPYADYYGRLYWLEFALYTKLGLDGTARDALKLPQLDYEDPSLPQGQGDPHEDAVYTGKNYLRYRKESTETPSLTYQISIVSDTREYIIGSALARNCSLVTGKALQSELRLYLFPKKINAYDKYMDLTGTFALDIDIQTSGTTFFKVADIINRFLVNSYKAWAICSPASSEDITVESEDGEVSTQTIQTGGELFIGKNIDIPNGYATIKMPYFRLKNKIYE